MKKKKSRPKRRFFKIPWVVSTGGTFCLCLPPGPWPVELRDGRRFGMRWIRHWVSWGTRLEVRVHPRKSCGPPPANKLSFSSLISERRPPKKGGTVCFLSVSVLYNRKLAWYVFCDTSEGSGGGGGGHLSSFKTSLCVSNFFSLKVFRL